jgi:hypothetical protein
MHQQTASAIRSVIAGSEKRLLKRKQYPPRYRLSYLSKLKTWNVPLRLVLRFPSNVLTQRNWGRSLGVFAAGDDGLMAAACGDDGAEAGETVGEH